MEKRVGGRRQKLKKFPQITPSGRVIFYQISFMMLGRTRELRAPQREGSQGRELADADRQRPWPIEGGGKEMSEIEEISSGHHAWAG